MRSVNEGAPRQPRKVSPVEFAGNDVEGVKYSDNRIVDESMIEK